MCVSSCSEASVFFFFIQILCDVSIFFLNFLWKFFFNHFFIGTVGIIIIFFNNRSREWVAFLSYFLLER